MYLAANGSVYVAGHNFNWRLGADVDITGGLTIPPFFVNKTIKDFTLTANFSIAVGEDNQVYICGTLDGSVKGSECRTLNTSVIPSGETIVGVGATYLTVYIATDKHIYFMGDCDLGACGSNWLGLAVSGWFEKLTQLSIPAEVTEIKQISVSLYGISF